MSQGMLVKLEKALPALSIRNYRNYWLSQWFAQTGMWMQLAAISWLVYSVTQSALLSGLATTVQLIPALTFSLFAGYILDRVSVVKAVLVTQLVLFTLSFSMFILVASGKVQYSYILVFSILLGFANAMDTPARQTVLFQLLGKEHFRNGIALFGTMFNATRIIGPAVAGLLMLKVHIAICFLLSALCVLPLIVCILRMDTSGLQKTSAREGSMLREIKAGITYAFGHPTIRWSMLLHMLMSVFCYNYAILLPAFVTSVLGGDQSVFAMLFSSIGAGAIVGAGIYSLVSRANPQKKHIHTAVVAAALLLLTTGVASYPWIAAITLVLYGASAVLFNTMNTTIIQTSAAPEYQGRVMSLHALVLFSGMPIGAAFAGTVSESFGTRAAYAFDGSMIAGLFVLMYCAMRYDESRKRLPS